MAADLSFDDVPEIVGRTVHLRPLSVAVLDDYVTALADDEVARLTGTRATFTAPQLREWLSAVGGRPDRADWAVHRLVDDVFLGEAVLNDLDVHDRSASYRIWLGGAASRGQGYGTEVTRLVLDHAFDVVGLRRLSLEVLDHNVRARRVYERCGFVGEGRRRQAHVWQGQAADVLIMGMLSTDPRPTGRVRSPAGDEVTVRGSVERGTTWNPMVPELLVSDLAVSRRFYVDVVGFDVRFERADPPFAYLDLAGAQLMLAQDHDDAWRTGEVVAPRGRGVNLQVEVPDLVAVAEACRSSASRRRPPTTSEVVVERPSGSCSSRTPTATSSAASTSASTSSPDLGGGRTDVPPPVSQVAGGPARAGACRTVRRPARRRGGRAMTSTWSGLARPVRAAGALQLLAVVALVLVVASDAVPLGPSSVVALTLLGAVTLASLVGAPRGAMALAAATVLLVLTRGRGRPDVLDAPVLRQQDPAAPGRPQPRAPGAGPLPRAA